MLLNDITFTELLGTYLITVPVETFWLMVVSTLLLSAFVVWAARREQPVPNWK